MTRLAISGHRGLALDVAARIAADIDVEVSKRAAADLVGLSCLADGADSIFAQAILRHGGSLVVVVPALKYREGLPEEHHSLYDQLLSMASGKTALNYVESTAEAHQAASLYMLDHSDELLAVWDGKPARGFGGTADVVHEAEARKMPITIIWPPGSYR
jgi:hypothetical protein